MKIIVFALYIIVILITIFKVRTGIYLLWTMMFCYPAWLLYGMMPMNAGLDDLLMCALFIGAILYCGGKPLTWWPIGVAVFLCFALFMGDISTLLTMETGSEKSAFFQETVKRGLKSLTLIFVTYAVASNALHNPRSIKSAVTALLIGACLAGFWVCFYSVYKYAYNPFQYPHWAMPDVHKWEYKAMGPFSTHDTGGSILAFTSIILYFRVRNEKLNKSTLFMFILTALSFISLLVSGSRSGWMFVGVAALGSTLFSRNRIKGILLIALGAVMFFVAVNSFEYFSNRLERTQEQWETGSLQERTSGRYYIWKERLSEPKLSWLAFGEGFVIEESHPHSNYVGMLVNMGLIGICFWIIYYTALLKKINWLTRYEYDPGLHSFFTGCRWVYVGYFFAFITCTPIMWAPVRLIDFFLMSIIFLRAKQLKKEYQAEQEHAYFANELEYSQNYEPAYQT